MLKWTKEKENWNDILNSKILLRTNHIRTFFNVKSCDIQQSIRYLNYFSTGTLTFHWQISGKRSTVFNNYKMSICNQVHLQKFRHTWRAWNFLKKIWIQIYQFWNLYCNTVEIFVRPKICKIFKFCMDELLKIATKEKFYEENFLEHQNFFSFSFTNKLWLPTWIFDVMYYFEW